MAEEKIIRLYLDEDVRPLLAAVLRSRGYDVISAVEKGLIGLSDEEQISKAIEYKRAFLTHNIKDFVRIHHRYFKNHYGIILSDQVSFRVLLRRILRFLSHSDYDNVKSKLIWLSNFD